MGIASQGMADKNRIVALRGKSAVRLIGDGDWPKLFPTFKHQRMRRFEQRRELAFNKSFFRTWQRLGWEGIETHQQRGLQVNAQLSGIISRRVHEI